MERPKRPADKRPAQPSWTRKLCGALLGAGLCGSLWSVEPSTQGGVPQASRPARLLATPVRFGELIRLLDDPRAAIRLEALHCLETLNRPAKDTLPALRRRFNDSAPLVRLEAVRVAIRAGMPVQEGVPVAAALLISDHPEICCPAARILSAAGPAAGAALPQLHTCLTAPSISVR